MFHSSKIRGFGYRPWVAIVLWLMACGSSYAQVKNPFDIIRSEGDTLVEEQVQTPQSLEEAVKIDTDNPFSVDHIPIRKNQYQQIENLTTSTRQAEENISLSYMPLWILMASMCMLAYMLFIKKDHLTVLIKSLFNDNFMRMTNYEENSGMSAVYIIGYLMFVINFALFLYLVSVKHFGVNMSYLYLILLGVTIAFFFGALGGVIIFIIFLLSRYYKTLRIGQSQLNNNFFHFFLYFCTLEFSPWVIVYKVVKDLI